jgi:hypothetical protein
VNGKVERRRRASLLRYWPPEQDDGADTVAIHTGLTVIVAGHRLTVNQDEASKTAQVVCHVIAGHTVTGLENPVVEVAAERLRERAQRFLGQDWSVMGWNGQTPPPATSA